MSDVEHIPAIEEEIDLDDSSANKLRRNFWLGRESVKKILNLVFSAPGLVVLVALYSVMGALIFPIFEAPVELRSLSSISKSREDCLKELWTITEKLNVLYERNWTMLVHEQLRRFEGTIVAAAKHGVSDFGMDHYSSRWSFSEALLYSVTVITTIGHGNLTPRTSGGKIVTIAYALIGVPLMLMCLSSLGGILASALQCTYSRFCCHRRMNSENHTDEGNSSKDRCDRQSHAMDCTICKYDAVYGETKLHGYEYAAVSDREDSCHLIRNSPVKLKHSSPCNLLQAAAPPLKTTQSLSSSPTHHGNPRQYFVPNNTSQTSAPIKYPCCVYQQQHPTQHNYQILHEIPGQIRGSFSGAGCSSTNPESVGIISGGGSVIGITTSNANTTTTAYFPISLPGNHYPPAMNPSASTTTTIHCSPTATLKYQGMQLQGQLSHNKGSELNNHCSSVPPPTPMHQQHAHTATVHGIRRGKYLPKPMPQEINILLVERDISSYRPEISTPAGVVTKEKTNSAHPANVDIMEDEEENEQNRIGCPHGTPSRIPLISSSSAPSSSGNLKHSITSKRLTANTNLKNHNNEEAYQNSHNVTEQVGTEDELNDYESREDDSSPQVPITIVLVILISYLSIGTVIFSLWENWSIIDGAYFCFVTLSTIGYGDFLPQKTFKGPDIQLFACCAYLLLGLVLVAMSFSILETQLLWKCKRIAVRLKLAKD